MTSVCAALVPDAEGSETGSTVSVHGTLLVAAPDTPGAASSYAVLLADRTVLPVRGVFPARARTGWDFTGRVTLPSGLTTRDASTGATGPLTLVGRPSVRDRGAARVTAANHRIFVAAPDNLGSIDLTDAAMLADVHTETAYWQQQANGAIGEVVEPTSIVHYSAQAAGQDCGLGSDFFAVVKEAAAEFPTLDLAGGDQLVVFVPDAPASCASGNVVGEGTVGSGFGDGGAVVVKSGSTIEDTLAHEAGHNYGLEHANVRFRGRSLEYFGIYDVMGYSLPQFGQLTALSTAYRVAEGITDRKEITTVGLGKELSDVHQTRTIHPRTDGSGVRSLQVVDPDTGKTLYLDYRCGCGQDAASAYAQNLSLPHRKVSFHYHAGVVVTERRGMGVDVLASRSGDTAVAAGGTWTNRSGSLTVRVGAMDATGAQVSVDYAAGTAIAPAPVPTIAGRVRVGSTLRTRVGTWMHGTTLFYQWYAGGVAVPGATGRRFTPGADLRGRTLHVTVTGRHPGYSGVTRTSAETRRVRRKVRV